jgi:hypothetical protein
VLLAAGFSASCFDHLEPGQILFDLPLHELVVKSVPLPLQGKLGQAEQSAEQSMGDDRVLFHGDYHTEVGVPREQCDLFLDKLAGLVSQRIKEKGARVAGGGATNRSRTVEYSRGRSSGSVEIFCLGDDAQRSHVAAVVDEVVLRGRG